MGNRDKRAVIKQSITSAFPDILCLQESKIQSMNDGIVKEVWGSRPSKCETWIELRLWSMRLGLTLSRLDVVSISQWWIGCLLGCMVLSLGLKLMLS